MTVPVPSRTAPGAGRAILHVDMDAFFVGVEVLDDPSLAGRPVVVGGTGPRGVVAAASYEARAFGVHSAQPMAIARRLCPQAVVLDGRHDRYREVSGQVMAVFREVTPLVEPLSLDEAFLDVTGRVRALGPPVGIAEAIRSAVRDRVGLSCSVGVAPNKFVAKLASQRAKPRAGTAQPGATGTQPGLGVLEIRADDVVAFVQSLPVEAIWGVGPATHGKLTRLGVATVADLAAVDPALLARHLGVASGTHLAALAWGRDERPVEPDVAVKSVSHEETFPVDIADRHRLDTEIVRLAEAVGDRLRRAERSARTIGIKVRFAGFRTITRSITPAAPLDDGLAIASTARALLDEVDVSSGVRLIGVVASQLVEQPSVQLTLDLTDVAAGDPPPQRSSELVETIDSIRDRFGRGAIRPARLAHPTSPDATSTAPVREPGARPWGPSASH